MSDDPSHPLNGKWVIDRRVPVMMIISFVGAILIQSFAAIWWASAITSQLANAAYRIDMLERGLSVTQSQGVSIAKIEEKVSALSDGFKDIKAFISALQVASPKK